MAFTQADLDRIDQAIATGERRVIIDGQETEFQSAADLLSRRRIILAALNQSGAVASPSRTSYACRVRD